MNVFYFYFSCSFLQHLIFSLWEIKIEFAHAFCVVSFQFCFFTSIIWKAFVCNVVKTEYIVATLLRCMNNSISFTIKYLPSKYSKVIILNYIFCCQVGENECIHWVWIIHVTFYWVIIGLVYDINERVHSNFKNNVGNSL